MEYRELPRLPKLFLDFVSRDPAVEPFLPCRPTLESLLSHAREAPNDALSRENLRALLDEQAAGFGSGTAALQNIQRLAEPGTVAVVGQDSAALLGGPLRTFYKCVTTIKLAAGLQNCGVQAVPILLLDTGRGEGENSASMSLPDREGKLHLIDLTAPDVDPETTAENRVPSGIERALKETEDWCVDSDHGNELLENARRIYVPGSRLSIASGLFLSRLLERWGLVILDTGASAMKRTVERAARLPENGEVEAALRDVSARMKAAGYVDPESHWDCRKQLTLFALFPSVAWVSDPEELRELAFSLALCSTAGIRAPVLWPRYSATILDGRSRKLLKKYDLEIKDLFKGAESVAQRIRAERFSPATAVSFDSLAQEIERRLSTVVAALPPEDRSLGEAIEISRSRMLYQVYRLGEKFDASMKLRQETMLRHVERLCNSIAPAGDLQEERLPAFYFILRYPGDFVQSVIDCADVWKLEHQTILLD